MTGQSCQAKWETWKISKLPVFSRHFRIRWRMEYWRWSRKVAHFLSMNDDFRFFFFFLFLSEVTPWVSQFTTSVKARSDCGRFLRTANASAALFPSEAALGGGKGVGGQCNCRGPTHSILNNHRCPGRTLARNRSLRIIGRGARWNVRSQKLASAYPRVTGKTD